MKSGKKSPQKKEISMMKSGGTSQFSKMAEIVLNKFDIAISQYFLFQVELGLPQRK